MTTGGAAESMEARGGRALCSTENLMNAPPSGEEPTAKMPVPGLPPAGSLLAEKYLVERVLGSGGMAVVLAARHVHLDQRVAIKLLLSHYAKDQAIVSRFLREGQAAARIKSEHVVRVHDVGVLPEGPYMVLELLEGMDLGERVAAGKIPIQTAVDYVLQAGEAIAEAHSLGIVHRDLKPSNLFLARGSDGTDCVKVLDFGISKVTPTGPESGMRLTATGGLLGTPAYMAPEQMRGLREIDARADIWGLGSVLYELCAGGPPFLGESMAQLAAAIFTDPAPRLRNLRPDAPAALDAVIERCLQKRPEDRYANMLEMAHALAPLGTRAAQASVERIARILSSRPGQSGNPMDRSSLAVTAVATTPQHGQGARGWGVLAAVGVAIVASAVGAVVYVGTTRKAAQAPSPPTTAQEAVAAQLPAQPAQLTTESASLPVTVGGEAPHPSTMASVEPAKPGPALSAKPSAGSGSKAPASSKRPFIATDREK
jgi:serine/threonine-protein kinase